MDITLKGNNGEKVVIPIEKLIQKYWSDENSKPNRIEMSAKVKDETILGLRLSCTIIPARKLSPLNPAMPLPAAGN